MVTGTGLVAGPRARTWRPPWPLALGLVVGQLQRGPYDPAFQLAADGSVWRAARTPDGPVSLRLAAHPAAGEVRAHAWGPGADWALHQLPDLLGASDDPDAFDPAGNRLLADARHRHPGLRLGRTGLVMDSLVPAVLEQKVTTLEAYRAWRTLLRRYGTPVHGGLYAPPTAREWTLIPSWEWHRAGVDAKRAGTVVRAARLAARLEEASALATAAAVARLTSVPGVGLWTAAETLQRSNGDPDAVSVGDYHLPNTVGWALAGRERSDDAQMLRLLAPYRGHRHRACRLILLTSAPAPRHGPRLSPRDYRAM